MWLRCNAACWGGRVGANGRAVGVGAGLAGSRGRRKVR